MLSRLLGLVREQVFAVTLGAGGYSDAFLAAFRIPNLLRDLFAEGALSTAFVPTYVATLRQRVARGGVRAGEPRDVDADDLSRAGGAGRRWLFPDPVVRLVATGFSPEKAALCATLVRIMMPFLPGDLAGGGGDGRAQRRGEVHGARRWRRRCSTWSRSPAASRSGCRGRRPRDGGDRRGRR